MLMSYLLLFIALISTLSLVAGGGGGEGREMDGYIFVFTSANIWDLLWLWYEMGSECMRVRRAEFS